MTSDYDLWTWSAELCLGGDSQLSEAGPENLGLVDLHLRPEFSTGDQGSGRRDWSCNLIGPDQIRYSALIVDISLCWCHNNTHT